jgi:hypothetical protein
MSRRILRFVPDARVPPNAIREQLGKEIAAAIAVAGFDSLHTFAAETKSDIALVSRVLRGKRPLPMKHIVQWSRSLGWKLSDMTEKAMQARIGDVVLQLLEELAEGDISLRLSVEKRTALLSGVLRSLSELPLSKLGKDRIQRSQEMSVLASKSKRPTAKKRPKLG